MKSLPVLDHVRVKDRYVLPTHLRVLEILEAVTKMDKGVQAMHLFAKQILAPVS